MPLFDIAGSTGAVAPEQIATITVKVGVMLVLTDSTSVAMESHPAVFTSVTL